MTIDWKKRQPESARGPLCQLCRRTEDEGDHTTSAMRFTAEGEVPRPATHDFKPTLQTVKRCDCGHYISIHTPPALGFEDSWGGCQVDGCVCKGAKRKLKAGVDYVASGLPWAREVH